MNMYKHLTNISWSLLCLLHIIQEQRALSKIQGLAVKISSVINSSIKIIDLFLKLSRFFKTALLPKTMIICSKLHVMCAHDLAEKEGGGLYSPIDGGRGGGALGAAAAAPSSSAATVYRGVPPPSSTQTQHDGEWASVHTEAHIHKWTYGSSRYIEQRTLFLNK